MHLRERFKTIGTAIRMAAHFVRHERIQGIAKGEIFAKLVDPKTGEVVKEYYWKNRITLDSSLLIAGLLKDPTEPAHGVNMLAVGTGATGSANSPDAPPNTQRRLNNEIDRKTFSEITFRDSSGNAVAYRTNVLDFTCTFSEAEAVGALNEMALMSTISDNRLVLNPNPNHAGQGGQAYDPTVDVSSYDLIVNFSTFGVINKPSNMAFTITWRLTT